MGKVDFFEYGKLCVEFLLYLFDQMLQIGVVGLYFGLVICVLLDYDVVVVLCWVDVVYCCVYWIGGGDVLVVLFVKCVDGGWVQFFGDVGVQYDVY